LSGSYFHILFACLFVVGCTPRRMISAPLTTVYLECWLPDKCIIIVQMYDYVLLLVSVSLEETWLCRI